MFVKVFYIRTQKRPLLFPSGGFVFVAAKRFRLILNISYLVFSLLYVRWVHAVLE